MSEKLTREAFCETLNYLSALPVETAEEAIALLAHDAALRAETAADRETIGRLREKLRKIGQELASVPPGMALNGNGFYRIRKLVLTGLAAPAKEGAPE